MRKISIVILLFVVAFASCIKDSSNCSPVNVTAPTAEVASLRSYLDTNGITATEDPRGFFYTIHTAGSDKKPTPCNTVTVSYKGTFTNGTQFDASDNITFGLSGLIIGWQEGIPLIATGGSITLYLPPSLAYGSADYNGIPGNSILIFDIGLKAIQ